MIEEVEYQNQGYGMHSGNEFQSHGSMQMVPDHCPHLQMMKPQHMHRHQTGFSGHNMHQSGYTSGHNMHHQQMGHYHPGGGGRMSRSSMNSSHFSHGGGGMFGAPDMSKTEYDSYQKVHSPGLMHESKYHQAQSSWGNNGGYSSGGGMNWMPHGGREPEWVNKGL